VAVGTASSRLPGQKRCAAGCQTPAIYAGLPPLPVFRGAVQAPLLDFASRRVTLRQLEAGPYPHCQIGFGPCPNTPLPGCAPAITGLAWGAAVADGAV